MPGCPQGGKSTASQCVFESKLTCCRPDAAFECVYFHDLMCRLSPLGPDATWASFLWHHPHIRWRMISSFCRKTLGFQKMLGFRVQHLSTRLTELKSFGTYLVLMPHMWANLFFWHHVKFIQKCNNVSVLACFINKVNQMQVYGLKSFYSTILGCSVRHAPLLFAITVWLNLQQHIKFPFGGIYYGLLEGKEQRRGMESQTV